MIAVGGICPLPEGDEKPSVYIEIHFGNLVLGVLI